MIGDPEIEMAVRNLPTPQTAPDIEAVLRLHAVDPEHYRSLVSALRVVRKPEELAQTLGGAYAAGVFDGFLAGVVAARAELMTHVHRN